MSERRYIEDPEDIRLNENRALQQILGNPPGWLLNWGNTFIGLGILIILALGWLVKYPDVVPTKVFLTTPKPPIRVFAETTGKLKAFSVKDNELVREGAILAILDNPADLEAIQTLDTFLLQIQTAVSSSEILKIEIPRRLKLGGLQSAYADFSRGFDEYTFFLKNNNTDSKVRNLNEQIIKLEAQKVSLEKRRNIIQQEVDVSKREVERNRDLIKIGGISATKLEDSEIAYYRIQGQKEALNSEIFNADLAIERARMQILETRQLFKDGRSSGIFSIQEDIQKMQSAIDDWEKAFLIKAPISGQVSFTNFRSAQQYINQNEALLTIVPENATEIIAKGVLPALGSGKVEKGMRANVRLDGYSYQEFGSIQCNVSSISLVPKTEGFIVELSLDHPLITTYTDTIPFQQEMPGVANIITEDRRILERVFDRILSILKNE